jgi:hypothetical protein
MTTNKAREGMGGEMGKRDEIETRVEKGIAVPFVHDEVYQAQDDRVALLAELARVEEERDGLRASRIAYASEFPLDADGEPDVGSIHENIRALEAERDEARAESERLRWNSYPHMCRDDHQQIGHSDSENERCPVCIERDRADWEEMKSAQQQRALESYLRQFEKMGDRIKELESERDAAVAKVVAVREVCESSRMIMGDSFVVRTSTILAALDDCNQGDGDHNDNNRRKAAVDDELEES